MLRPATVADDFGGRFNQDFQNAPHVNPMTQDVFVMMLSDLFSAAREGWFAV
jgi:hypothetical protein